MFDTIILLTDPAERDTLVALLRQHNPQLAILDPQSTAELAAVPLTTLARARIVGFLTPIVEETVLSFLRDNGTRLCGSAKAAVHPRVGGHDITC